MEKFIDFIKKSPTTYQAVDYAKEELIKHGATELLFSDNWKIEANKMYFITKDGGSIIAFKVGSKLESPSIQIVASHTDSPMLKIKPNGLVCLKEYTKINSEVYGGLIYSTFLDRPLGIAGRVVIKELDELIVKNVVIPTTVIIPNVCIHMNRDVNNGYKFNAQVDMEAILSLNNTSMEELFKLAGITEEVLDFELYLYNKETPLIGGAQNELILSPRLDDLECFYTSFMAFLNSQNDKNINMWVAFNNEEVGSNSNNAAGSTFLVDTIDELLASINMLAKKQQIFNQSMVVSADNAHAEHPNHPEKTDSTNMVYMNKGIVIKYNAGLSYTTNAISAGLFKEICNKASVPYQVYTNRSDMRGGSTLGCILLKSLSIISVDIGLAQLAMHSAYETAGIKDINMMIDALQKFYSMHLTVKGDKYKWNS